jgi:hypothetical protein
LTFSLRGRDCEELKSCATGWDGATVNALLCYLSIQWPTVGTAEIVHYYVSLLLFALDLGCVGMYSILVGFGRRLTFVE